MKIETDALVNHVGCGTVDAMGCCVLCELIRARLRGPVAKARETGPVSADPLLPDGENSRSTRPDSASAAPSIENLRQQVDAIREHFVMRASERGCMGAVVIDGVCCTSELPLVDWCDECLMGRMASLLESPAVLDHERSLVAEIQRLKEERGAEQQARLTEVEHWVSRYRELDEWRIATTKRAEAAEAEIQRLTDALNKYGQHDSICALFFCDYHPEGTHECTCGLMDALTEKKRAD